MRLICEATKLEEQDVEKLSGILTEMDCDHEKSDTSIIVDYDGPMNQHALAIITAVEAYGCHRVVMTR